MLRRLHFYLLIAILCCFTAAACKNEESGNKATTKTFHGRGVILMVDKEKGQLRIKHDKIEGLMDAMTMSFDVRDHSLLESLSAGDIIEFTLEVAGQSPYITAIKKIGPA